MDVFKLVFLQKIPFNALKYALLRVKTLFFFVACLPGLFSFSCDAVTSISVYFSLLMRCEASHLFSPERVFFSVVLYDFVFILIIHPLDPEPNPHLDNPVNIFKKYFLMSASGNRSRNTNFFFSTDLYRY